MPTTLVNRHLRCRKARVGKRSDCNAHGRVIALFRMEHGRPANRTEPEYELSALIADTNVLGGGTGDSKGCGEARQRRKYTAAPSLAGEAVAHADVARRTVDFNAQLPAGTRGRSGRHRAPREINVASLPTVVTRIALVRVARHRTAGVEGRSTVSSFTRPDAPDLIATAVFGHLKCAATSAINSSLALPSTGGARSRACQEPSLACVNDALRERGFTLIRRITAGYCWQCDGGWCGRSPAGRRVILAGSAAR